MNELYAARGRAEGLEPAPAYIGLGFSLRGEALCHHMFGTLASPGTFGNYGAGTTLFWIDPVRDITFTCLSAGVMEHNANTRRFQKHRRHRLLRCALERDSGGEAQPVTGSLIGPWPTVVIHGSGSPAGSKFSTLLHQCAEQRLGLQQRQHPAHAGVHAVAEAQARRVVPAHVEGIGFFPACADRGWQPRTSVHSARRPEST